MPALVPIGTSFAAACSGLIAYAAVYPRSQLFGATLCRTNSPRKLAITFDDGPNPAMTPRLLDLLEKNGAHATFFLIGRYARKCPELVRETAARGHVVANHTETHANLFWLGPSAIRGELHRAQDAITKAAGFAPRWFRPPYGLRNPWVVKTAAELSLRTAMWTLIPGDWTPQPAEKLIENLRPVAARTAEKFSTPRATGDIVCLHDGGHRALNADRTHTLKALDHWLPRWRDTGFEFVTIEEAVGAPAN